MSWIYLLAKLIKLSSGRAKINTHILHHNLIGMERSSFQMLLGQLMVATFKYQLMRMKNRPTEITSDIIAFICRLYAHMTTNSSIFLLGM